MTIEGRILLFDTVNLNNDIFPNTCIIDIPEKVPLTWNFDHEKVIGIAEVSRDELGLTARAELFSNERIGINDISSVFENGRIGSGGFYNKVKMHSDGSFKVIDEATLREVALVLAPVRNEYYFEIVSEGEKNE